MGRPVQFRWPGLDDGPRVHHGQRRVLDRGVSLRRPATRRDAGASTTPRPSTSSRSCVARRARRPGRGRSSWWAKASRRTRGCSRRAARFPTGSTRIWSEDWHHAAFVAATGRREAYFTDYQGNAPRVRLDGAPRHAVSGAVVHLADESPRRLRARICRRAASSTFSRITIRSPIPDSAPGCISTSARRAGARSRRCSCSARACRCCFKGRSSARRSRFTYFADHESDLAAAVEQGRLAVPDAVHRTEPSGDARARCPTPADAAVFAQCRLQDAERDADGPLVRLHRDLIRLRRDDAGAAADRHDARSASKARRRPRRSCSSAASRANGHRLLVVNLADDHLSPMNDPLFAPAPGTSWTLLWSSEQPDTAAAARCRSSKQADG